MKFFGLIITCFFAITLSAQDRLVAMGSGTNLYIVRVLNSAQPLSSLADQYNVLLPTLAKYNSLHANAKLRKGDEVKIPLTANNFTQRNIVGKYQPVYHIFKLGDNLSRISQRYNKLNIDTLKKWNSLVDDVVPEGKAITIGFMSNIKVVYASAAYQAIAYDTIPNPNVLDAAKFGAKELKGEMKPVAIPVPKPPVAIPILSNPMPSASQANPSVSTKPALPYNTPLIIRKPALVAPSLVQTEGDYSYRPRSNDEGFFAHIYYQRIKDRAYQYLTGDAAIFKTVSGWTDRKFYVLINEILPGTIVRVTGANKKSICAKVLGPLPETKGAAGLLLRMNNAAAAALGMDDQRFTVSITYVEY